MEKEKIKKAMKQAEASLHLEGLEVTEAQRKLVYSLLSGEISEEEFHQKVHKLIFDEKKS